MFCCFEREVTVLYFIHRARLKYGYFVGTPWLPRIYSVFSPYLPRIQLIHEPNMTLPKKHRIAVQMHRCNLADVKSEAEKGLRIRNQDEFMEDDAADKVGG